MSDPVAEFMNEQEVDDEPGDEHIQTMPSWKKFLFSKWGCAVILSFICIILILFIRPAFILKRRRNILSKPQINWLVVFILWIVLFVALLGIPALVNVCKKKWVQQKA